MRRPPHRNAKIANRKSAFTLVEILIVVVILGILAAIVIPQFSNASGQAARNTFVAQVKQFATDYELRLAREGSLPADVGPGTLPAGMEDYIDTGGWARPTPVGGRWDWDFEQFGVTAAVSVYQPTATTDDFLLIDQAIDDGDLSTGSFRSRSDGYMFVIRP